MIMRADELTGKDRPLTMEGVKKFKESLQVGEVVPTMVKVRVWTSGCNFVFHEIFERVEIVKKFPFIVQYQYWNGDFDEEGNKVMVVKEDTWNEFVIGYLKVSGLVSMQPEKEDKAA